MADLVEGLSPAERDAFLAQLSDEDLRTWREYQQGTADVGWTQSGLPHWDRLDLDSSLLATTSAQSVDRLAGVWPELRPTPPEGSEYQRPGGPFDNGQRSWRDVNQGGIGDCWALAALAGQGRRDPSYYDELARQNDNGTVSVRLYDEDGNPHWVTVTGELPVNADGNLAGVYGDTDNRAAASTENWPAHVENALARAYEDGDPDTGGYANLHADHPENAFQLLTGREAHVVEVEDIGTDNIRDRVNNGEPVVLATNGGNDDAIIHRNESGQLVGGHAYFVHEVLPDGRVVLGNPWGSDHPLAQVTLTQEELREYTHTVTVGS